MGKLLTVQCVWDKLHLVWICLDEEANIGFELGDQFLHSLPCDTHILLLKAASNQLQVLLDFQDWKTQEKG